MAYHCKGYKGGTNEKGIKAIVTKAFARAEWYKTNYAGSNDFLKRYVKQYESVVSKWEYDHELTEDQEKLLESLTPQIILDVKARLKK
jgi:RNA processing factor Prp31